MRKIFFHTRLALVSLLLLPVQGVFAQATSTWVFFGSDGLLHYQADQNGNRIMDYSYAGYKGGGVKLPDVPAATTPVAPTGGDDTSTIQAAIDAVSQRTPDGNGFRGAVLLSSGTFNVAGTLTIITSGVVLRGSGSSGSGATVVNLTAPPASANLFLNVHGSGTYQTVGNSVAITDSYVPSGTMSFNVADTSSFKVGDTILITRPVTAPWVHFMGMDTLVRNGQPETWLAAGSTIRTDRTITAINGNQITIDVPLTDSFDSTFLNPPGGSVARYTFPGRISQIGLEHLKIVAPAQDVDISQPQYQALTMDGVIDAWARDVFIQDTENTITFSNATKQITLDNVTVAHSIAFTFSAGPVDFAISGTQVLINKCEVTTNSGVWAYATHARTAGPVVLLNSSSDSRGFSPHQRWATGLLADRCHFPGGTSSAPGIAYSDRGTDGTGHGWDAGWAVAWNVESPDFLVQEPPGVNNWCIGCIGNKVSAIPPGGTTVLPNGIYDSLGTHVTPPSLYIEQLRDRLGDAALVNIGYADFAIAATPTTETIAVGGTASFALNLTAQDIYTGNVKLSVNGLPAQAVATFTPALVNGGSGSSILSISSIPLGNYPLTITGSAGNLAHLASVRLLVAQATTTNVSTSANPSPASQPITFIATVLPSSAVGTVQFQDGTTPLGPPVIVSNGSASFTVATPLTGTHAISAVFTPTDSNFLTSMSPTLTEVITTSGTGNPSRTQLTAPTATFFHQRTQVAFTVTVTATSMPTGSVILLDGNVQLGPTLNLNSGAATYYSPLRPGMHNLEAVYLGSSGSLDGSSSSIQTLNASPRPKPR